jgi:hypothetical protein
MVFLFFVVIDGQGARWIDAGGEQRHGAHHVERSWLSCSPLMLSPGIHRTRKVRVRFFLHERRYPALLRV